MRIDGQEPDTRRQRRTSGQRIAKSISIKDAKRRSGNCAPKATELTPGGLRRVPSSELRKPRGDMSVEADDLVVHAVDPGLALLHQFRFKTALSVARDSDRHLAILALQDLGGCAIAPVALGRGRILTPATGRTLHVVGVCVNRIGRDGTRAVLAWMGCQGLPA